MSKLIYGIGFNSKGRHKTKINGTYTLVYSTWQSTLKRCYCAKYHEKNPAYIGCSVANEWHDFQGFANWFEAHEYSSHGYHLDKDLLVTNNKVYGPETCCFVPQGINSLLADHGAARGLYPQGVSLHKPWGKYLAAVSGDGKIQYLGLFDTEQEAYQAYKVAKEAYVKQMANHWQDGIADEVYDALMSWELDPK